ncbi:MAG TPA: ANTAR domain-containing protein, partial [Actinomycetota bacterium]|nr:ANTAR domain-containing protein [Actinomycetota bacterium]
SENLRTALESREIIGEAKGILMAREQISADEAFDVLRRISQTTNVKLRDVAVKIVESTQRRSRDGDPT